MKGASKPPFPTSHHPWEAGPLFCTHSVDVGTAVSVSSAGAACAVSACALACAVKPPSLSFPVLHLGNCDKLCLLQLDRWAMKTLGTPDFCSLCYFNSSCLSVFRRPSNEDTAFYSCWPVLQNALSGTQTVQCASACGSHVVLVTLHLPKTPLACWHADSQVT